MPDPDPGVNTDPDPGQDSTPRRPSNARERAEAKREEKLATMREQVQDGSLVIRQMTDEERERYPVQPERPGARKRPNRW